MLKAAAAAMLAALAAHIDVAGAASDRDLEEIRAQQQRLDERMRELRQQNRRLRNRIRGLETERTRRLEVHELRRQPEQPSAISETSAEGSPVDVGYNEGGGGFYIETEDAQFRLLGYAQALASVYDGRLDRDDGHGDFSIRRARIDFLANFYEDFELLVEFDGGPGTTPTAPSDFALVEARLNWRILDDALQLRVGKFVTPFSTENLTTSRAIDTIERYMALNSLFLLPALDAQFGGMTHGTLGAEQRWTYYVGAFNGNGRANDNLSDDNSGKEIQAKLLYQWTPTLETGFAVDFSHEQAQTLSLTDLGFNRYVSAAVEGSREGLEFDLAWRPHPLHLTAEFIGFRCDGSGNPADEGVLPQSDRAGLYGGFVQPSYFITGDENRGVELLFRPEFAHLDGDTQGDDHTLYAATLGANWFINPNTRLQVFPTLHYFDGPSRLLGFDDSTTVPLLLTELQFKF